MRRPPRAFLPGMLLRAWRPVYCSVRSAPRSPAATLCAAADELLADVHARVVCHERACRVFDLSGTGIVVDGARVSEALLADGSRIEAGRTAVTARVEPDDLDSWWAEQWAPIFPEPDAVRTAAAGALRGARDPLYAIIDNGRDRDRLGWLWAMRSGEPMAPVPIDADEQDYAYAAPHVVRIPPESPLLDKLLESTFGRGSTVFLTSRRPFADVLAFLRALVEATLPNGSRALFRFYDPLVLTRLLTTPDVDASPYFGPVTAWFVEDSDAAPDAAASHAALSPATPADPGADAWALDADAQPAEEEGVDDGAPPPLPRQLVEYRPRRVLPAARSGDDVRPANSIVRVVRTPHRLDVEGTA